MSANGAEERKGPSLTGRFAAAIALTIGFYVLALGLAAALIGLPVYAIATGHFNLWLVTSLFLGVLILTAVAPRRARFEAPGALIDRASQPRLLGLIDEEARAMDEKPPDEVYATMEVNAAVMEAGRRRRVMIVGLPLLELLTERGFRGVVAHELGHYAGGDTRLGPWIYRTRETIGRTIGTLTDDDGDDDWTMRLVRQPFIWYGRAFLRITNAISRRQEFAADACAVARAGRDAHVEALRRVHAYAPLFDTYWQDDVVPALSSGIRPPLTAGFGFFAGADGATQAASRLLDQELAEGETDPYDSHPALAERIAAVEHLPAGEPDESGPAIKLVDDPEALESKVVEFLFGPDARSALEAAGWDAVGPRVYLPAYEDLATRHAATLSGITFATLPEAVDRLGDLGVEMRRADPDLPTGLGETADAAAAVLAAAGVLALRARGWTVAALPGQPVLCRRDDVGVSPHQLVAVLRSPEGDREKVEAELRELGVADVALTEGIGDAPESPDVTGNGATAGSGPAAAEGATATGSAPTAA